MFKKQSVIQFENGNCLEGLVTFFYSLLCTTIENAEIIKKKDFLKIVTYFEHCVL